jgi:uroporphyrinogen-III synthase
MTGAALAATSILVTRPQDQADNLCRLICDQQGTAINWPAVRIAGKDPDRATTHALANATPDDIVIFVSRNAVRHGVHLIRREAPPIITTVGPSTATEVEATGLSVDVVPYGHDSEGLLAQLDEIDVIARQVFILRGTGGRETLRRGLEDRGASVDYVEVYARECPQIPDEEVSDIIHRWTACEHRLFTATSIEILENLLTMLGPDHVGILREAAMVTASRRVVQRADSFGHCGARLLAPGPDDSSLLDAMIVWRNGIEAAEAPQGP